MLSNLPNCMKKKQGLRRKFKGRRNRLARRSWRCKAEDDLSISHKRTLFFQIDAHHREDDARREKNQSRGSSPPRATPDYVMELLRGRSEENQATFMRNLGSHGLDDVSSLEGDKPQVGVDGQDMTETPCL